MPRGNLMPARIQIFYFGRLNLIGVWENKRKFVYDALNTDVVEIRGKFKYGFFDVEELDLDGEPFVFGRLVKYKPLLEGEIVNEDKHELTGGGLPDGVVAKSEFFLNYRTGVVSYRPISNRLSANQFRELFAALIEAAHHNFFVDAEVESIDEDLVIEEALSTFKSVNRISVDLHPTNPSNREIYRRLDERLRRLRANRLKQTIESYEGGLDRSELKEDDTYRGLLMAVDGYGKGAIRGETQEGRKVTIYTDDSPVTKEIAPSETPSEVLYQLMPTFRRIWERMANNGG